MSPQSLPMSEMVEQVAKAMCVQGGFDPHEIMPNDGPRWKYYEPAACTAIEADARTHRGNDEAAAMNASSFNRWLSDMKLAGLGRSDAACARLLGVSANTVVAWKRDGTDTRTALACRALLHRLEPYQ